MKTPTGNTDTSSQIHSKLMQTCTIFATYTNWLTKELEKADPDLTGAPKPPDNLDKQGQQQSQSAKAKDEREDGDARIGELFEVIRKWETNFSRHLQILLDALNHYAATETVVLLSLCARLSTANQGTEYAGLRNDEEGGT